jgi:hypothetical protein
MSLMVAAGPACANAVFGPETGLSDPYRGTIMLWDSPVSDRCRLTTGFGR